LRKQFIVDVRRREILMGRPSDPRACPVALAVAQSIPLKEGVVVTVGASEVHFLNGRWDPVRKLQWSSSNVYPYALEATAILPTQVKEFTLQFDLDPDRKSVV